MEHTKEKAMSIENKLPDKIKKHWMLQHEATEALGVSIKTLWEWRKSGVIESRKYAGSVIVRKSDVNKKLNEYA